MRPSKHRCVTSTSQGGTAVSDTTKLQKKFGAQFTITQLKDQLMLHTTAGSSDDFAEIFSPPQLCPMFREVGLQAAISADVKSGWTSYLPATFIPPEKIIQQS